jgi:hypothetical protein
MGTPNRKKVPELHHEKPIFGFLKAGSKGPYFREKYHVQHLAQVTHAACAACAAFEANDTLHGREVPEAPKPESIFQISQFFAQLVQVPVLLVVSIDKQPSIFYLVVGHVWQTPVSLEITGRNWQATARQKFQTDVVQRWRDVRLLHNVMEIWPV